MAAVSVMRMRTGSNGFYTGSMGHADVLQSIISAKAALRVQAETIVNFVSGNFLKLNTSKCELLLSHISNSQPDVSDIPFSLPASTATKCLETRWTPNLSPKISRAYFGFGVIGASQGHSLVKLGIHMVQNSASRHYYKGGVCIMV